MPSIAKNKVNNHPINHDFCTLNPDMITMVRNSVQKDKVTIGEIKMMKLAFVLMPMILKIPLPTKMLVVHSVM